MNPADERAVGAYLLGHVAAALQASGFAVRPADMTVDTAITVSTTVGPFVLRAASAEES